MGEEYEVLASGQEDEEVVKADGRRLVFGAALVARSTDFDFEFCARADGVCACREWKVIS